MPESLNTMASVYLSFIKNGNNLHCLTRKGLITSQIFLAQLETILLINLHTFTYRRLLSSRDRSNYFLKSFFSTG